MTGSAVASGRAPQAAAHTPGGVPETGRTMHGGMTSRGSNERELMGDARERLVGRLKDAAETAGERVQHVAQRVVEDAKDTATSASREEGLTT